MSVAGSTLLVWLDPVASRAARSRGHERHVQTPRAARAPPGRLRLDAFGRFAEKVARFFGTPGYIVGQTIVVIIWIAYNGLVVTGALQFDPYPFILLNLAFSTQAAYAAPRILLASTRQAQRDKASEEAAATHREELAQFQKEQLEQNTEITKAVLTLSQEIDRLKKEIRARQFGAGPSPAS